MSFVIVLISKRGYLKTTENKSSCQPSWVACKKNDLTEKSCPNRLGLELKRMEGIYIRGCLHNKRGRTVGITYRKKTSENWKFIIFGKVTDN